MTEFTDAQRKILPTIEKLLNLAAGAGTPHEAASATAKAQQLLLEHNLSADALEDTEAKQSARREQAAVEGGKYAFQRDLWRAVAELNFCHYWQRNRYVKETQKHVRQHCMIGRVVNTKSTIAMGSYLQGAIERMAVERVGAEGWLLSSKWAWDYRRGAFRAVVDKLYEARATQLNAEQRAQRKAERENMGSAPGTALTIAALSKAEEAANYDFQFGEGAWARKEARHIKEARISAAMEAAYTRWAEANPKAALSKFKFVDENGQERMYSRSYGGGYGTKAEITDWTAYRAGKEDGSKIGLHAQAGDRKRDQKLITGKKDIYL